ncbi:MAG TPA: Ig-like domain-containing protein [Gemmatimonadaceae bacterium]|nr:Ig-like domain-containing protein [Gemmatimonadaceae bacterium]
MPQNVRAEQRLDGRIRVTWSPVEGATAYSIVRSVPPDPAETIAPNVTDTVFLDSRVSAGKTYYYVVSGKSDVAAGMRASAPPVRSTITVDTTGTRYGIAPTNVVARYNAATREVVITWRGSGSSTFTIESRQVPGSSWTYHARAYSEMHGVRGLPPGTRWQFRVNGQGPDTAPSPWTVSNEVVIDSSSAPPTSPTGPTSTTGPAGTVAVTIGSAITMRVGATASAGSALGGATASRWVSLDEGIATVDASGTVTARTAGRARILAIAAVTDGSVRVTLVQVTVSP